MGIFRNISFRTKVTLTLLLLSLISVFVFMIAIYNNGKKGMTGNVFKHLTSVRAAKQHEIEEYFKHTLSFVEILGDNPTVVNAAKIFKSEFRRIDQKAEEIDCRDSLSMYYVQHIEKLSKNLDINYDIDMYYPHTASACYLQYEYIVNNPYEIGEKNSLTDAKDGTAYNEAHKKYHSYFNNLIKKMGFYDIFLIDLETGDIVYSVFKEVDFATNLYNGPYSQSNLAELARSLNENRDIQAATVVDFKKYRPSYGAPASFIGIPLTEGAETVGALVVQISDKDINRVMASDYNWKNIGLGKTGETYLVGRDYLMRSISRFYLEDTLAFKQGLINVGVVEEEINDMYNVGTTILNLRVQTEATEEALMGKTGTKTILDYRGTSVLSSYAPLQIAGLHWGIISEIDHAEANEVLHVFKRKIFITVALLLFVLTFFSSWIADFLVAPIQKLKSGILELENGNYNQIKIRGNDEFMELTEQFNELSLQLENSQKQVNIIKDKNEKLLYNFIPQIVAKRIQAGEKDIVELHSNVSLIIVDIDDFTDLKAVMDEKEAILKLNQLIEAFDSLAKRHHIEKIRTQGDNYYASCGLFTPRIDHCKRVIDFALELKHVIENFNLRNHLNLSLIIGVSSGPVTSAIVGKENFNFDLFGSTVNNLFEIRDLKKKDQIIVDHSNYQKTKDFFEFEKLPLELDFEVAHCKSHLAEKNNREYSINV